MAHALDAYQTDTEEVSQSAEQSRVGAEVRSGSVGKLGFYRSNFNRG
jgi:hypothetical protein